MGLSANGILWDSFGEFSGKAKENMSNEFSLTIVIPTYDRNRLLVKTVSVLLPQLSDDVDLVIMDNHSPTPVIDTLAPCLNEHVGGKFVSIVRNRQNIGGDANIVRCFEYANGDWIWVLADDDTPSRDAVSLIKASIAKAPNLGLINYYAPCATHPQRTETTISQGIGAYIENMDAFGSHLFLSTSIYRTTVAHKYLKIAHRNIHTLAAHVSIALCYMQDGGTACQSSEIIVRFKEEYAASVGWSRLAFGLGCSLLPDLLHESWHRQLLRRKIAEFLPFKTMYAESLIISRDRPVGRYGYFMYREAIKRIYFRSGFFSKFFLGNFLSITLFFPNISYIVASGILKKIKGSPSGMSKMRSSEDMLSFHIEP